jgi:hypothetical protein
MNKLSTVVGAACLLGVSTSANAWWGPWGGGPGWGSGWNDWWNDFFGDASFDFNLSMSAGGRGWGRGWNRWNDYYGYGPYWGGPGGYGYPYGGYPYGGYGLPYAVPVVPMAPAHSASK